MSRVIESSLGGAASRGTAVTLAGQVGRVGLQFVSLIVLSRILTPAEFGVVAMATAIIGVGDVLRDFGLTQAAVQAKVLSPHQRGNLFWLNTSLGLLAAALACLLSPAIAWLFGDVRLIPITLALSSTFLINGLSTQYRATLNRNLKFAQLAIVDVGSMAVGVAVSIAAAIAGAGYWALVFQAIAMALAGLVLATSLSPWLPSLPHRFAGTRQLVRYGANLMGTQVLVYATRNVDSAAIGATSGATALGLYNRAFELTMAPLSQIQAPSIKVALPVLSKLQEEPKRFNAYLLRGQVTLLMPMALLLGAVASQPDVVVGLLLGPQWGPAAAIMQVLCIGAFAQAASYATYWAFLAKGLTGSNLRFALVSRPIVIGLILIGALFGVAGVTWAFSVGMIVNWILGLWWLGRADRSLPVREMAAIGLRCFAVFGSAAAVSLAVTFGLDFLWPDWLAHAAGGLSFLIVISSWYLFFAPIRADVRDCLAFVQMAAKRRTR